MDHHRSRSRDKRGGGMTRVSLGGVERHTGHEPSMDIPAFVEAVERLEGLDERTASVTKLRVLWGLSIPEIAETLDVSVSTVEREWRFARRWLSSALQPGPPPDVGS
jgi:DNA-directed RNA polymerase specialized sigma24 family protein